MCKSIAQLENQLYQVYKESSLPPQLFYLLSDLLEVVKENKESNNKEDEECTNGKITNFQ